MNNNKLMPQLRLITILKADKYHHCIKADFSTVPWFTVHFIDINSRYCRCDYLIRHAKDVWSSGKPAALKDGSPDHSKPLSVSFFNDKVSGLLEAKYQNYLKYTTAEPQPYISLDSMEIMGNGN